MTATPTPLRDLVLNVATWNPLKPGTEDETFSYVDLSAVDQDLKAITGAREISCSDAPSRARQIVRAGDVLVSTVRPNLNGVALVSTELDGVTASTGFCVIRPNPELLDSSFVFHWVKSPSFVSSMVNQATGASYPAVSDRIVLDSRIPLPPLPEQRRIAAILDKADALRTKRREALAQLDRLALSIFVEIFGDPVTNRKGWKETPFDQFFSDKTSSCEKLPSSGYQEAGMFPVVDQGQAAIAGYCDDESLLADVPLPVTVFGDHTRAVKHVNFPFVVGADGAKVLRAAEGINPRFASHLLATLPIPNLGYSRHMKEVKRLAFISPPRELQDSFETRLTAIDKVREQHQSAARSSDILFTAIQHRAFRGEL